MNTPTNPPILPPSAPSAPSPEPLPGSGPGDRDPVQGPIAAIEAILRQPRRVLHHLRQYPPGGLTTALCFVAVVAALVYGLVVGTFSGGSQLWAVPIKVAAGLLLSAAICLPSLYIFACLSGSDIRLREVVGRVAGSLALMTLLLIGFAPVAWVFSQSTDSIVAMGALHLAFGVIATYFGLRFLQSGFSGPADRSGGGVKVWMVIFVLVLLQMTTALRPLLGTADTFLPQEKKFFLTHWSDCVKDRARE